MYTSNSEQWDPLDGFEKTQCQPQEDPFSPICFFAS